MIDYWVDAVVSLNMTEAGWRKLSVETPHRKTQESPESRGDSR